MKTPNPLIINNLLATYFSRDLSKCCLLEIMLSEEREGMVIKVPPLLLRQSENQEHHHGQRR